MKLEELRVQIDRLDSEIISLLNQRAQVSLHIGETKRNGAGDTVVYVPAREKTVYDKVKK